jgi:hypothetical protein
MRGVRIISIISQVKMYARFAWHLGRFLRTPYSLEQCRAIIRDRLAQREDNLLALVRASVYGNPGSPYLKLLKRAGCEYGDLDKMIRSDGIETTLNRLRIEGVYLSVDEFKGKTEVVRGELSFLITDSDIDNPLITPHLAGKSGGSRSAGTRTNFDLDYLALGRAAYTLCLLDALDALDGPHILWAPITPGFGPLELLACVKMGKPPAKWFSPVISKSFKPPLNYRMATNYIVHAGNLYGANLPAPEYVPLDEAWRIAEWMAEAIRTEGSCCIDTYTSNAVRICQAARETGLDLTGAKFLPCGEPLTRTKRQEIEATGAIACTRYVFSEGGYVSFGCLQPNAPDDTHLLKDSLALIQHDRKVPHAETTVEAFLYTTLLPASPKVLLNVENGDYGVLETRHCGCQLEGLGFTEHISNIRGFDKLTGEGMTFIGTDLLRIIEEVLPRRFGGASTDYQLVEEEDERGQTRVSVLVNPDLGAVDENALLGTILSELAEGKSAQRMMTRIWSDAGTIRIRRARPLLTARGKLLPLHIHKTH